ncbi:MAG: peptidylprolyl isomerase [Rhodobacterales bacterium]|jgi:peptidyl-prolyl cis-trans isomerase C|nr:peptidylprolyl isomerase [Pseudomonadota bacterium]NQW13280.1 peptidylprolyl isomerase [Rhodobacter sp.]HBN30470.1 peptidylprolyl isomerase [Paracoccaceae bacterium]
MKNRVTILTTVCFAASLSVSAFAADAPTAKTVLATVGSTEITLGHVIALRGRLPQEYQDLADDVLMEGIVKQLAQQTVLMDAINADIDFRTTLGLENEARAFLAGEMLARISEHPVSEEDVKNAYAEKYDSAIPDQEFNASHILVATQEEAQEIVKMMQDGADFATLAREKSTGPSGPNGGQLGWFGKGAMVPEFEAAVIGLAVGEVSAPVKTQFGWHVVRLNEMRNRTIPTLEDERAELTMKVQQQNVQAEIERMTAAANVVYLQVDIDPAAIRDVSLFDK